MPSKGKCRNVHHLAFIVSFCITLISTLYIENVYSDPIVTNLTSTSVNNGSNLTIQGNGFGNGPNVILFDDFEKGQAGQTIKTGPGSATYGGWGLSGNPSTTYYDSNASVSGRLAFRANMANTWLSYIQANLPAGTKDVFVSWWLFLPAGNNFPGYDSGRVNWKQMWIQGNDTIDDDLVVPTALGDARNVVQTWYVNGNETDPGYRRYTSVNFSRGQWKRLWVWIKGGIGTGQFHFWELDGGVVQRVNDNGVSTLKAGGAFERVRVNGYGASAPSCYPTFDDVYVAAGPYARARVEIGNSPSYSNCTKLSIFTPVSWRDSEITATARTGSFKSGENAYLFIIDANGIISNGRGITIGQTSGGGAIQIDPPSSLEIVKSISND